MLRIVRSFCFSDTMLWYSLQWNLPSASVKAALVKTTWWCWLTSMPYAWQSWAVSGGSKDRSWASRSRGKRQLRLLNPWLYISSRSRRHAARCRCSAQACRKLSLRANRSKRTGFLSRKLRLMASARVTGGALRSGWGSWTTCCAAWDEPAEQKLIYLWRYYGAEVHLIIYYR